MTDIPAIQGLANEAVRSRGEPLTKATALATSAAIVDWFAVCIGGSTAEPARRLLQALVTGPGPCRTIGSGHSSSAETAALINGTAAHTLELDDIFAPGLYHPGAPAIAATVAVAERYGRSGADLLRSVAVGYEVGNRVARTLGAGHYRYWHTTGTAGSLAAAAGAAEVLCLDSEQFAHALALATTMSAGLQQTFRSDSMGKPLHSGHAAQVGTVAALAAMSGFTGSLSVLDGEIGMGVAMSDTPSWDAIADPFGPSYLIEATTVKPYPCCGHVFAAIDAALQLHKEGMSPEEAERVDVYSYSTALTVAGNPDPMTPFEAKFSMPYVVARALVHGEVGPSAFSEEALGDKRVRELMDRVLLHSGGEFDSQFPDRRGARVTVARYRGQSVAATVPDRRGDPANPVTAEEMSVKFSSLVSPVLGEKMSTALYEQLQTLDSLGNIRDLQIPSGGS